jgi:hypothetical protein
MAELSPLVQLPRLPYLTAFVDLHQSPYCDEGLEDFRDFVNFIDGVGLSAQWTPEYDFDWVRIGDQLQASRRCSREPERPHSPESEDIGTPFSTWLPSAPADDQVHLRSHTGDGRLNTLLNLPADDC